MAKRKKVSIRDIAIAANVSSTSVSLTLNGQGDKARISPETQEKILSLAKELNYTPPTEHQTNKHSDLSIGVFFPIDRGTAGMERFSRELYQYVSSLEPNIRLIIHPYVRQNLHEHHKYLSPKYYDGVIMCGMSDIDLQFLEDCTLSLPTVFYNRHSKKYICVADDAYENGAIIGRCLRKAEHKNITILTPESTSKTLSIRKVGLTDTFLALGGNKPINIVIHDSCIDESLTQLFSVSSNITALYLMNDTYIFSIMDFMRSHQIRIPDDIMILSEGDHEWNSYLTPSITSLQPQIPLMARDCIDTLLSQIKNPNSQEWFERNYSFEIIYRESFPNPY